MAIAKQVSHVHKMIIVTAYYCLNVDNRDYNYCYNAA